MRTYEKNDVQEKLNSQEKKKHRIFNSHIFHILSTKYSYVDIILLCRHKTSLYALWCQKNLQAYPPVNQKTLCNTYTPKCIVITIITTTSFVIYFFIARKFHSFHFHFSIFWFIGIQTFNKFTIRTIRRYKHSSETSKFFPELILLISSILFTKVSKTSTIMFYITFFLKNTTRFIVERYLKVHFLSNKWSLNYYYFVFIVFSTTLTSFLPKVEFWMFVFLQF